MWNDINEFTAFQFFVTQKYKHFYCQYYRKLEVKSIVFNNVLTSKMMGNRKSTKFNCQNNSFNCATFAKSHKLINLLRKRK